MGKIYYQYQGCSKVRLLQIKPNARFPISQIGTNEGKILAKINFPFFSLEENGVIGRYQGDEFDQRVDQSNFKGLNLVITKDMKWHIDYMNGWDFCNIKDVALGCCPSAVLFKDKPNSELVVSQTIIDQKQWSPNAVINRVAILYANNQYVFAKGDGYSVDAFLNQIKADFPCYDFIALGDGGGSAELIDANGKIQGTLQDGKERPNYCCASFILEDKKPVFDCPLHYPCKEGWDSNPFSKEHQGLDFGWCKDANCDIVACADGIVEFEGFYEEYFKGVKYRPIGVIIRHPQFDENYDLVSIYWHLSKTLIDKGNRVIEGQVIGKRGCTGYTNPKNAVHLHFQLIKVPKGAEIPKSYEWKNMSIDPTPLLVVHKDQLFDYSGNFNLKREGE